MSDDYRRAIKAMIKRSTPVSQQVVLILEKWICGETYDPGDRLPSESQLAKEFSVSRATVRTALAKLETAGLILRKHGDGTCVAQPATSWGTLIGAIWQFDHLIQITGRTPSIEVISSQVRQAGADEAEQLRLGSAEEVAVAVRLFYADDAPVTLSRNVFPITLFLCSVDQINFNLGIQDILSQFCDQEISYTNARIAAVTPDQETQLLLRVNARKPLLNLKDVFFNRREESPIVFSDSYLKGDEIDLHQVRPWY